MFWILLSVAFAGLAYLSNEPELLVLCVIAGIVSTIITRSLERQVVASGRNPEVPKSWASWLGWAVLLFFFLVVIGGFMGLGVE